MVPEYCSGAVSYLSVGRAEGAEEASLRQILSLKSRMYLYHVFELFEDFLCQCYSAIALFYIRVVLQIIPQPIATELYIIRDVQLIS
ncbi:MAG: hypothetical protein AB4426_06785 [Xenococcaceae cyanobacterium]